MIYPSKEDVERLAVFAETADYMRDSHTLQAIAHMLCVLVEQRDAGARAYTELAAMTQFPAPVILRAQRGTREETDMEHIARDMREGRFPERSERLSILAEPQPAPVEPVAWRTGLKDKAGREICLGDHLRLLNSKPHVKPEYWLPEYEVVWTAPSFHLRHIGGGKNSDPTFAFRNYPNEFETIFVAPRAAQTTPPEDWRNEPESDERWCAGNAYALTRLCAVLGVDPDKVDWDGSDGSLQEEADALLLRILHENDPEEATPPEDVALLLARAKHHADYLRGDVHNQTALLIDALAAALAKQGGA